MLGTRKLPVASVAYDDESIEGFVARGCYVNGFDCPRRLLKNTLGHPKGKGTWQTILDDEHAKQLAHLFGGGVDRLTARFHTAMVVPETKVVFESFFGVPIRVFLRDSTVRRFSPAALRAADYHRASWLLRSFRYCPESGERLIGACPKCDRNLGWQKTYGIGFCEHCVEDGYSLVDLREVERPRLSESDFADYSAAAYLLSQPAKRSPVFPRCFENWPSWELFDLITTLASILVRSIDLERPLKRSSAYMSPAWHTNFMTAIRIVKAWPESAQGMVDRVLQAVASQGNEVPGYRARILGPLATPELHAGTPRVAFEIRTAVESVLPLTEQELRNRTHRGARSGVRFI